MPMRKLTPEERKTIEDRQQAELEGDTTYVMTRAEDRSFWIRAGAFYEKYKLIFILLAGALLALGFDFKTPKQFYADLESKVNEQARQMREAEIDRRELSRKLDVLITFRCLEQTVREMAIAGVKCTEYITNPNSNPVRQP